MPCYAARAVFDTRHMNARKKCRQSLPLIAPPMTFSIVRYGREQFIQQSGPFITSLSMENENFDERIMKNICWCRNKIEKDMDDEVIKGFGDTKNSKLTFKKLSFLVLLGILFKMCSIPLNTLSKFHILKYCFSIPDFEFIFHSREFHKSKLSNEMFSNSVLLSILAFCE
jgi:hypothetical protein